MNQTNVAVTTITILCGDNIFVLNVVSIVIWSKTSTSIALHLTQFPRFIICYTACTTKVLNNSQIIPMGIRLSACLLKNIYSCVTDHFVNYFNFCNLNTYLIVSSNFCCNEIASDSSIIIFSFQGSPQKLEGGIQQKDLGIYQHGMDELNGNGKKKDVMMLQSQNLTSTEMGNTPTSTQQKKNDKKKNDNNGVKKKKTRSVLS